MTEEELNHAYCGLKYHIYFYISFELATSGFHVTVALVRNLY